MSDMLQYVVRAAITAGFAALVVMLLRLPLKKAPRWITVALWGIVALRLLCPFSVESPVSIMPPVAVVENATGFSPSSETTVEDAPLAPETGGDEWQPTTELPETLPTPAPATVSLSTVLTAVWASGVLAMLLYGGISAWRLHRRVREAAKEDARVYRTAAIDSPFVLGVFRPRIYLPSSLDGAACDCVLAHERAHIKRGDHLIKPFAFLLLAVYWFQPLLWVAYVLLCRDIEAACDERVVRSYTKEERQQYSYALVSLGVHRRSVAACPVAFGETGVKARVKQVMHYKKPAVWILAAAVLISAVASVCLLTDRKPTVGATLGGGTLTVKTDSGVAAKEFALEEGARISVRDHTPLPFTATIDKVDDDAMAVVIALDTPLYLDGVKTTTVTVPFDKSVTLRAVEPYDGAYDSYTFTITLPSAVTKHPSYTDIAVWSRTCEEHTRYEGTETTLVLAEEFFLLDFGGRSEYIMKGTYAFTDTALILTEDAHLTEYVFDIDQNGDIVYNDKASYRHEKAKTQSLDDGEMLKFCYAFEDNAIKNAAGETVVKQDAKSTVSLLWYGNHQACLQTSQARDDITTFSMQYVDMARETVIASSMDTIGYNSTMFAELRQSGNEWEVVVCGVNNDFGGEETGFAPKELLHIALGNISTVKSFNPTAFFMGNEEVVVMYNDDDDRERVVVYNVRTGKAVTRRLLTLQGNLSNGQNYGTVYRDNFDALPTAVYRNDPSGRVLFYNGIFRAFVYLDGEYIDLHDAFIEGKLTIESFEELCKADAEAYLVEGGTNTYRDGGTTVYFYKYKDDYHNMTFRHKLSGDHNVYVGKISI